MECKAFYYYFLLNFRLGVAEKTTIPLKLGKHSFSPIPENGVINLQLRKR